ncbi:hypothetical protein DOY81_009342 [Sarcophaga bullata]|nr:hypothetical protein DOY81_009342 [Sarcophaga bullata]
MLNESLVIVAYKFVYLTAVTIQLSVYCYNGQRIKDESALVATGIHNAYDWSHLDETNQKLLIFLMMLSTRSCNLREVFFELDLVLYLWVSKTASSLITALKTLEDKEQRL